MSDFPASGRFAQAVATTPPPAVVAPFVLAGSL